MFGEEMSDSLVFSPASNFMSNTPGMSPSPGNKAHSSLLGGAKPKTDGP